MNPSINDKTRNHSPVHPPHGYPDSLKLSKQSSYQVGTHEEEEPGDMRVPNFLSIVRGMMERKKQEYREFEIKLQSVQRKIDVRKETLENT